MLEIVYADEHLVAINKPHGLLVHASGIARDAEEFALQLLRDQLGQHVYPCHRLDRKTSGVLLFALSKEIHRSVSNLFMENAVSKSYEAIVRGHTPDSGTIDYALINEKGKEQSALTHYTTLKRVELDLPFGKHATSRYSLVAIQPITGRMHQIRKHFAHIFHPIIGDRPHGCNKQNRLFKEKWNMERMLLHCRSLSFAHPISGKELRITAEPQVEFLRIQEILTL